MYACCRTDATLSHHVDDTRVRVSDKDLDMKNGGIETPDTKVNVLGKQSCEPNTRSFFPHTPFCCHRGPYAGRPRPRPDYVGMSGHAAGKRRGGRWFGEKIAEERRISVDIGCPGERVAKARAAAKASRADHRST